ncbi:MAG: type IX secretion system protein PorQ [Bacteroidota bacterium]
MTNSISSAHLFFWLLLLYSSTTYAQLGGRSSFAFLKIPSHARLAAVGGVNISLADRDVNMLLSNPALLDSGMHNQLAFNFVPYYADIAYPSLVYARRVGKAGMWGAGLQYLSYGEMPQTDDSGNDLGTFRANEFAFTVAHAHTQGNFTIGASLKLVGSTIETYSAYAVLADMGSVFKHPESDLKIALAVKNVGFRLSNYTSNEQADLPLDVQIGASFKPEFMPFRFSLTAHHLQRFDIAYNDPSQNNTLDANGNVVAKEIGIADKIARHFVFGGELLLHKSFNLRFGYNHLINRELRLANASGGAGFSFGAMLRVKAFEVAFSRMYYHAAGGRNSFTFICDMGRLIHKQQATINN